MKMSIKEKISITILFLWSIILTGLSIFQPFVNGKLIDNLLTNDFYKWISIAIFTVFFIKLITFFIANIKIKLGNSIKKNLQFNLIEIFSLKTENERTLNDTIYEVIKSDTQQISTFYTNTTVTVCCNILKILAASYFLVKFNVVFFIIVLILSSAVYYLYFRNIGHSQQKYDKKDFETMNIIDKWIEGIYKFYIFFHIQNLKDWAKNKFCDSIKQNYHYRTLQNTNSTLSDRLSNLPSWIIEVLIYIIGGIFVIKNKFSLGSIIALVSYSTIFQTALKQFFSLKTKILVQKNSFDRVKKIIGQPNKKANASICEKEGYFILKNMNFSYSDKKIFNNVNLEIPLHGIILIQGGNGNGKSTLLKLMKGDLIPTSGEIFIDGKMVSKLNMYEKLSQVNQNELILNDTFENNIIFLKETSKKAEELFNDIVHIKNVSFNDTTNENVLSGGEKKRLLLSRSIFNKKKIFIFDEVDTGMDSANFENYIKIVKELSLSSTVFLISHHNFTEKEDLLWNYKLTVGNGNIEVESKKNMTFL